MKTLAVVDRIRPSTPRPCVVLTKTVELPYGGHRGVRSVIVTVDPTKLHDAIGKALNNKNLKTVLAFGGVVVSLAMVDSVDKGGVE